MKAARKRLCASFALSALLLGAGPAFAQEAGLAYGRGDGGGFCTLRNVAGRWGYTVTGSNTSGGPDGIVGTGLVDARGKVTLNQTEVTNGEVRLSRLEGRITVDRNCTGTLTGDLYEAGKLVVTATWALVFVDNQKEIRGILTKLALPGGGAAPLPVQLLNAKLAFPGKSGRD